MERSISRRRLVGGAACGAAGIAGWANVRRGVAQESSPVASPAAGGDARTISAVNGDITITGTPERVVVMEYELAENLSILGVTPVGVTERDEIPRWVQIPEYPEDVVDVGLRDEPDIEAMVTLDPDLILAASPRQDAVLANLESISTVVQIATYSPFSAPTGLTPIESFQKVLTDVALTVNRGAEATEAIAAFDALLAAGAEVIAGSEFAGRPFLFGSFNDQSITNLFNDQSRIAFTIGQLGLTNLGEENQESPGLHYVETSVEQLGTLPDETIFFTSLSEANAVTIEPLFESEFWQAIPFVRAGNFYYLGQPNVWAAGSAITLSDLIRRVVTALTGTELP